MREQQRSTYRTIHMLSRGIQLRGRRFVPALITHPRLMSDRGFSFGRGFATGPTTRPATRDQASGMEEEEMEMEDSESHREHRRSESSQSKI